MNTLVISTLALRNPEEGSGLELCGNPVHDGVYGVQALKNDMNGVGVGCRLWTPRFGSDGPAMFQCARKWTQVAAARFTHATRTACGPPRCSTAKSFGWCASR